MTAFTDTVRFCFPAPSSPELFPTDSTDHLPLHARDHPSDPGAGQHRFQRPEEDDLSRGILKFSAANALKSYVPDWILAATLWAIYAVLSRTPGHQREFSLKDISIQHSFAEHERVPPMLLAIISVAIPLAVLLPISILISKSRWDIHNCVIGLFMSYTMSGVVTQAIKMTVGRPRPDLLSRCIPIAGAQDHPVYGLSTAAICTTDNQLRLDDGFKSFPSGHSSLSFAGLGFLSLYLAGKMHLWARQGHRTRAWWALTPLLGALMVAISRTEDNRHHWQDVLVGSTLGLFVAWVSYRTYYPPLSHRQCHLPLAPRAVGVDDAPEDEEAAGGRSARVRLLGSESNGNHRPSEEETAWRSVGSS